MLAIGFNRWIATSWPFDLADVSSFSFFLLSIYLFSSRSKRICRRLYIQVKQMTSCSTFALSISFLTTYYLLVDVGALCLVTVGCDLRISILRSQIIFKQAAYLRETSGRD
jgi:hypothetical protein